VSSRWLSDRSPRARAPVVATLAIVLVLVVVHVATAWWESTRGPSLAATLVLPRSPGFRARVGGQNLLAVRGGETWRLCTSVLLHTGGLHLVLNVVAVAAVGRLLEPWAGSLRLAGWFVIAGVAGSVASQAWGVRMSDGASGAVLGLVGVGLVVGLRARERLDEDLRGLLGPVFLAFAALNLVLPLVVRGLDGVAHAGGLAAGLVLGAVTGRTPLTPLHAVAVLGFAGACAYGWGVAA
jgi:membrane associated rhomboid family serine protease